MAKTTYSETLDHTTDAGFQAWATNLHNALVAVGLVQTTDTGQADFTTMTRPGGGSYLYRIYRYSDALQSTAPVFLRVEYGTSGTNIPGVRIGIGRATDGAGNLTVASVSAPNLASPGGGLPGTTAPAVGNTSRTWVCWKDGAFTLAWACDSTGLGSVFRHIISFDRSRNGSGVANGECLYWTSWFGTNMWTGGYLALSTGMGSWGPVNVVSCWIPGNPGSSTFASKVQAFKHFSFPQQLRTHLNPMTAMSAEIGNLAVIDVEIFGTTHTYLFPGGYAHGAYGTGYSAPGVGTNVGASTSQKPLLLWET